MSNVPNNPWPGQPAPIPQPAAPMPQPAQPMPQPVPPMQQPAQAAWQPAAAPSYPAAPGYATPGYPAAAPKPAAPVSIFAWLVMAGGALALICSFLPYYTIKATVPGYGSESDWGNAWNGFFGWFGILMLLAAAAIVAAQVFADLKQPQMPLISLGLAGIGLILVVIALFVFPGKSDLESAAGMTIDQLENYGVTVDMGRSVGYWLSLVCAVVAVVGAVMFYMEAQKAATPAPAAYPQTGYPQAGYPQATPAPTAYQPAPTAAPAAPTAPAAYPPAAPATPAPTAYPQAAPLPPQPPAAPAPGGYPSF